ncbi:mucin-5AC isoform X2 [Drosophila erecta]|uniref:mucin-5AC isoform X2 n=1 Tax=Drosophila erecta TaxID=7220 RepID=UPI0001781492|nr:mucin-5AC isoform X2 [Drosophila erecta]
MREGVFAAPPSAGTSTSGAAATAQPTSTKKEKHQRSKQADKEKDKDKEEKQAGSGKRKKEKISVEKIDTGDFVVGIGDKLKVNYHEKKSPSSHGSTYEAKVIEISVQRGVPMYLVHYTGWNNRYDEWVPRERIAENLTKGSKQKTRTISTSSANSGSGGGGGGGGSLSVQGTQPPGVSDKHQPGKDGSSKMPPSSGNSSGPPAPSQSGSLGGASSTPSLLSTVVKTPTTGGAKRGRGRSDSMPPRSTTPSSVVAHSGRTKSPAASQPQLQQQMKKRPTRVVPGTTTPRRVSDASMASESDSDSDEPVRRPKRQSTKDKPQAGKAQTPGKGRVASRASSTAPAAHPSDDSEEEDDEEEEPSAARAAPSKQQQQQAAALRGSRAGGNRAMSSGAASAKGRDYDLSEIRSELKGFQPKILTNAASNEERKDLAKKEPSDEPALQDIKKEPKLESSAKSSSTELSSETESYADEDSQSSDYRKQPKVSGAGKKEPTATPSKLHHDPVSKRELAVKEEPLKIEPKTEPKEEEAKSKPFLSGADIKPTTLIAPARFGNTSAPQAANSSGSGSTTAKYTSVIVEKPLTIGGKKSVEQHVPKKAELLKKQSGGVGGTGASSSLTSQESKKFAEPVASLKVEMPAACSPSSSSSSSSSFCSTGSAVSSSSATRSLPDMSKLEISSGTVSGATPGAAASQPANATQVSSSGAAKESKYSSSGGAAAGSGISMRKLLSSDVYEFKDTEPFEFEKRISPMASVGGTVGAGATGAGAMATAGAASVITAVMPTPGVSGPSGAASASASAPVMVGSAARKQALKASAIQHILEHQSPTAGRERGYGGMTSSLSLLTAPKLKKRGSPLKEPALCLEKSKIYKLDKDQVQQPVEQKAQQQAPATSGTVESYAAGTPEAMSPLSTPNTSSGHAQLSASSTYSQLTPHHATPFDALRKSPSFNLNITALNEELAQTVQETTRALTDALQPPTTPGPPPVSASGSTTTAVTPVITPTPTAVSAALSCPSTPPTGANPVLASPKLSTPPQAINASKQPPAPHIVGSPFIETRNVFELSTSNEGSGYSSGESKDNKFEKLENVKILLAGAVGPFDLDAGNYEQKTSSIADKVLKAISQKKEEVENNKSKPPVEPAVTAKTPGREEVVSSPTAKLELCSSAIKLDTLKLLSEPLKIQTGPLLGELYRPGPATSSPETKSILESSLPAKNSELSETIQKLECAIQQRKTPVGGALSLASSTAGTPPTAHTPNSTATAGAGFSDESMDSTDSEQRLVIEDVIAEEHTTTTTTGEQKSPGSQPEEGQTNTATMATAVTAETEGTSSSTPTPPVLTPVKLELGAKAMPGIQAPIPLKPAEGSSFAGKLSGVAQPPPLAKLQQQEEMGPSQGQSKNISSFGIPIVLPEIPASVVVATPALMVASAATVMRHSPGSTSNSPAPVLISPKTFLTTPKVGEVGGLLLKAYTGVGGAVVAGGAAPAGSVIAAAGGGAPTVISNFPQKQQQQSSVLQAAPEMPANYVLDAEMADAPNSSASVVARPFVMHAVGKELFNVVAPAASSPLISDLHNDSINLLCEETIPGSPAPNYGSSDQLPTAVNSALAIVGITPLPPDTPPPVPVAAIQQQQAAKTGEVNPSAPNSSPDSASQDESGEETKKNVELEHEDSTGLGALNKRKRTRKPLPMSAQAAAAVAAQLQSLGKRRRQVSGMRNQKTTTATAGSDTDDNSDNIAPNAGQQQQQQRQSARQQMMPQGNAQQQLLQQQQTQLQQAIQSTNSSGVRPCPYNFLVELDPALSSDECITILRKQIQDLRKAYNTIKGELAVIDRRRKKLRRREREKKQQQMQSQQQGKICA